MFSRNGEEITENYTHEKETWVKEYLKALLHQMALIMVSTVVAPMLLGFLYVFGLAGIIMSLLFPVRGIR